MSEKKDLSGNLPLSGVRVLVGRAKHQAGSLSAELRKLGADVVEIPFIEIRKPRSFKPLDSALKTLHTYDWLILTSVNGVDAMWERIEAMRLQLPKMPLQQRKSAPEQSWKSGPLGPRSGGKRSRASAPVFRVAAIGPATRKAIEQRGLEVDVVPKEYVAESVVRSLKGKVKGKRVLLIRAKVARDVIPRELRKAGAHVDIVEAYETVVPQSSRRKLQAALKNEKKRPHVVTFTSSSTVKNFIALVGKRAKLNGIQMASIGPVTSATLRECGLNVDIAAREFTIPGLITAISKAVVRESRD
jgi:uroporphyrinogen-III synthase